jgi:hypothetical protein
MKTYYFPQFDIEMTDPTIEDITIMINGEDLQNSTIKLLISLSTPQAKSHNLMLDNLPVVNHSYEGHENLMERAMEGLSKYEVK